MSQEDGSKWHLPECTAYEVGSSACLMQWLSKMGGRSAPLTAILTCRSASRMPVYLPKRTAGPKTPSENPACSSEALHPTLTPFPCTPCGLSRQAHVPLPKLICVAANSRPKDWLYFPQCQTELVGTFKLELPGIVSLCLSLQL